MASYSMKYKKVAHIGNNVSHAKNRTKRTFKRNLHRATIIVEGVRQKVLVPTKVLKQLKKAGITTHWQAPEAE